MEIEAKRASKRAILASPEKMVFFMGDKKFSVFSVEPEARAVEFGGNIFAV